MSPIRVVPIIDIPESILAGLYTVRRNSTQMLLGRRPEILTEMQSALRFCVFAMTESLRLSSSLHVGLTVQTYFSWYLSGRNFGRVQFTSTWFDQEENE